MDYNFSVEELTAAISSLPFEPKQLAQLGWFENDSVRTTVVKIERESEASFGVVASVARGSRGESAGRATRDGEFFEIGFVRIEDVFRADEVQGVRAHGTDGQLETVDAGLMKVLRRGKARIGTTLEHMRIGALKGQVLNKDGTVLWDFWNKFGLSPNTATLDLASSTVKLRSAIDVLTEQSANELGDAEPTSYEAIIGAPAFRALVESKAAREEYLAQVTAGAAAGRSMEDVFDYGGVRWHKAKTRSSVHSSVARIEDNKAYIVPRGIPDFLIGRFGPADWIDSVNLPGVPVYAKSKVNADETGWDVDMKSCPFFAPTRPRGIVQVTCTLPT